MPATEPTVSSGPSIVSILDAKVRLPVFPEFEASAKQTARRQQQANQARWKRAQIAERQFQRALVNVGRQVGAIIDGFVKSGSLKQPVTYRRNMEGLDSTLRRYADLITPWAQQVTERMHYEVAWRGLSAWKAMARSLGRNLTRELREAPYAPAFGAMMAEQVHLIRSIPLETAERVHERTIAAMSTGARMDDLIEEIMQSGQVAEGRARLIARTETARTASVLTQVRAQYAGSEAYIWRTSKDAQVRPEHQKLEGRVILWSEPPLAGANMYYHAGQGPNCRCYPEPLLPT
jgi:SPP1 gp7 family putative phage head morphogenesis protein